MGYDLIIVVCAKKRIVGAHSLAAAADELIQDLAGEAAFEGAQRYKWLVRT